MRGFTLLWQKILRSSLWVKESKETRLVWIAMLALRDQDGKIFSSVLGLADAAKVTIEECRVALGILTSPDVDDTSGIDEGRRIREIQGGWEIVTHDIYRFSTEAKREFWKQQQAEYRASKKKDAPPIIPKTPKTETGTTPPELPSKQKPSSIIIPDNLSGDDFSTAWSDWCADRKERKKPLTNRAMELQLKDLSAMGKPRAIEAIRSSIRNGYTGIFEPGGNNGQNQKRPGKIAV